MNVHAEVVDTSMAYKETVDSTGIVYPKGTIKVRLDNGGNNSGQPTEAYATPLNANDFEIPITGEHVLLTTANTSDTNIDRIRTGYFYSKPINAVNNLNVNVLTGFYNTKAVKSGDQTLQNGIRNTDQSTSIFQSPKLYTFGTSNLSFLQPFEGDRIIQSRFGSAIRFSSTVKGDTSIYNNRPPWDGSAANSPLIVIANGISSLTKNSSQYAIENINDDNSSIYITSEQQVDLKPSQVINETISTIGSYSNSQVIINADRLVFNSKSNSIVLSASETIAMSTPDWKLDMNKFFNLMYQFVDEVTKIANQQETIATGVGPTGLSTNVAKFIQIFNDLTAMKSSGGTPIASISTPEIVTPAANLDTQTTLAITDTATLDPTGASTVTTSQTPITQTTPVSTAAESSYQGIGNSVDTASNDSFDTLE
jgi:hypothetical protein